MSVGFTYLLEAFPEILDEGKIASFEAYFKHLVEVNKEMNLTRIESEEEAVVKHFYDCLAPSRLVKMEGKLVDVGSGAGFPGIVYAIAYPDLEVTLVESAGKKCSFLHSVKELLNLNNVKIVSVRAEKLKERGYFDIATARAVAPLNILIELLTPLIKVGGHILALKGKGGDEELASSSRAMRELKVELETKEDAELPFEMGSRCNIVLRKTSKSPRKYPRDYSEIKKNPL